MAGTVLSQQQSQALVASIQHGSFPESEEVIASDFKSESLQLVLDQLGRARLELANDIGTIDQDGSRDIDDWVSRAKTVQAKIERSKLMAKEIVAHAQRESHVLERYRNSSEKARLLSREVSFNAGLVAALENIQQHQKTLDEVEAAPLKDMTRTILQLNTLDVALEASNGFVGSSPFDLLKARSSELRLRLGQQLDRYWNEHLATVDLQTQSITLCKDSELDLETVVEALKSLHQFDESIHKLYTDVDSVILQKRLSRTAEAVRIQAEHQTIQVYTQKSDSVEELLEDLETFVRFIHEYLPSSVAGPLSDRFMPGLITSLISTWLPAEVPTGLTGMDGYQKLLENVRIFARVLDEVGFDGQEDLHEWIDLVPRTWLTKQREKALDSTRDFFFASAKVFRVKRVETRKVSAKEYPSDAQDDWDAGWSGSAGDEDEDHERHKESKDNDEDDEGEAAWGWGDEDEKENKDEVHEDRGQAEKQITLEETFSITQLPKAILGLISQILEDGDLLSLPENSHVPVLPARAGLLLVPTLVLAMYRAAAPLHYSKNPDGGMYMYNDSLWLADELQLLSHGKKLEKDVQALHLFGKRAYSREMETQRTILGDVLDGAQGFGQCVSSPFAEECENAVQSAVDRMEQVAAQWKTVLSHSARLQSLGSLLTSLTNKFIVNIEDMGDISEAESQQLSKFCSTISTLEKLFVPAAGEASLTVVYCSSWLKFQYLANILESSLVDIKYLWTEGELKLEYTAGEVVDLIEALFSESDHRRKAIIEIRQS